MTRLAAEAAKIILMTSEFVNDDFRFVKGKCNILIIYFASLGRGEPPRAASCFWEAAAVCWATPETDLVSSSLFSSLTTC